MPAPNLPRYRRWGEVLKNAVSAGDVYAFQQRQGAWGRDAA